MAGTDTGVTLAALFPDGVAGKRIHFIGAGAAMLSTWRDSRHLPEDETSRDRVGLMG